MSEDTMAAVQSQPVRKTSLAYGALLVFSFLYFARPEDVIPGLPVVPLGKIAGGIALLALLAGLITRKLKAKFPLELKLLLLLFAHLSLCIVFAYWRGGSFQVVMQQFSKAVIVALLVALIVENVGQLRKLFLVQVGAVAVTTFASLLIHPGSGLRLQGLSNGILGNPNDLAMNLAINWPFALAFLLAARGVFKKGLWAGILLILLYSIVATYSRSGSIAMGVCFLACVWQFAIRGRRFQVLIAAGILAVVGAAVMISTPHYLTRMRSTIEGNIQGSGDSGSIQARRELLRRSIQITLKHPLFGVGPGNFPVVTETWKVTHNTYTELSSETGLPGLLLFLLILILAFANLRRIRKTAAYKESIEIQLYTSALWAGLATFLVGAAFSSTEYTLFPYFLVAYTSALYRIASTYTPQLPTPAGKEARSANWRNRRYSNSDRTTPRFAGTR
jgi:O-antigen ligase